MKPALSFFLLLCITSSLFGQPRSRPSYTGLQYSQKFLTTDNFNHHFNTLQTMKLGGSLTYVGIFSDTYVTADRSAFDHNANFFYNQLLPQPIQMSDGSSGQLNGFALGFTLHTLYLFSDNRPFNVIFGAGANAGRLVVRESRSHFQKNPSFAPKLRINPILTIRRLRFSLAAEYEYEIGSSNWRKGVFSKEVRFHLPGVKSTGLSASFGVSYHLVPAYERRKKSGIGLE